jgi:glycerol-3-phosphate dehydrogenase subunit B
MFERIAVAGAGVAGLAACWAAAQRGAEIELFDARVGASCLSGGAVDDRPWEEVARSVEALGVSAIAGALPVSLETFSNDLGVWRLPAQGEPLVRLATEAGRVRVARGHERALLDLAQLPFGGRVLLPRVARAEWDADSLARALNADAYAQSRELEFEAVDAKLLKLKGEDRIAAAELAVRHDDAARLAWLAERLRDCLARAGGASGVLLGPWLGADKPLAGALSQQVGVVVGEILSGVGSAAGLRFESARLAMLSSVGVQLKPHHIMSITRSSYVRGGVTLELDDESQVEVDAVVLAIGGLVGGGIIYDPPEDRAGRDMARAGGVPFQLSLRAPLTLQAMGKRLDVVGSMLGPALDAVAWPVDADPGYLEAVGVASQGAVAAPGLFAAGDCVADQPRTVLQAAYSGIVAGAAAAGEPGDIARAQ